MEKNRLKKVMGTKDVIMVAFGAMIGWGWVISSGEWIQKAGVVGTVLGFIFGGIMIYFVGLTYAELTTAMPECGGVHVFVSKAFGKRCAFISTWAMILSYVGVVCFEACSLPTVIQYIFPDFMKGYLYTVKGFDIYFTWIIMAIACASIITIINIHGIKSAVSLQNALTLIIGGVGIILVVSSAIKGEGSNCVNQIFAGNLWIEKIKNIFSIGAIAPFFLFGFDVIPQVAEEVKVPLKKMGKLLMLSIILAVGFYACVVLAIGFILNGNEIQKSMNGTGLVAADAMAKAFNSDVMAKVMIIAGMCGIITSWNAFLIGGSRAIYALSKDDMLPKCFSKLHRKYGTPVNALLLIGSLSVIAPFFGKAMLLWVANASSLACCVAYCFVAVSFLVLRKKNPTMKRPYKIKRYGFVGVTAILLSGLLILLYIVPNSGSTLVIQEFGIIGLWIFIGIVLISVCNKKGSK